MLLLPVAYNNSRQMTAGPDTYRLLHRTKDLTVALALFGQEPFFCHCK